MTTEEFWDKYMNEDILDIFDTVYDFFSKELPADFIEKYDVDEVILETKGHQESAKNFENVLKFTELLQNKQPELYFNNFQYFDDFLVDYYCYKEDASKIKESISNFIINPLRDFDFFLQAFNKILYYQHSELVEDIIEKCFDTVSKSSELMFNAEYDLAQCKYYMLLQDAYMKKHFDETELESTLKHYNFEIEDNFFIMLKRGLFEEQIDSDTFKAYFKNKVKDSLMILEGYFLRYMYDKGFNFYLSCKIWENLSFYWQEYNKSKKTTDKFFNIQKSSFDKRLASLNSNFFFDNNSEVFMTLWGSVYVYEFLLKYQLISENAFENFAKISKKLKGEAMGLFTSDLWNYAYIHKWQKPDSISETEFNAEKNIFKKSIDLKNGDFNNFKNEISQELSELGQIADIIINEAEKNEHKRNKYFTDDVFDDMIPADSDIKDLKINKHTTNFIFPDDDDSDDNAPYKLTKFEDSKPITVGPKIGRNEPCPCGSGKKYKKCCLNKQ